MSTRKRGAMSMPSESRDRPAEEDRMAGSEFARDEAFVALKDAVRKYGDARSPVMTTHERGHRAGTRAWTADMAVDSAIDTFEAAVTAMVLAAAARTEGAPS